MPEMNVIVDGPVFLRRPLLFYTYSPSPFPDSAPSFGTAE